LPQWGSNVLEYLWSEYPDYSAYNEYPDYSHGGSSGGSGSCGANLVFRTLSADGKDAVLERHNKLRSKVALGQEDNQPSAANMRKLSWSSELEEIAQSWADNCVFEHSTGTELGENLATRSSSQQQDRVGVEQALVGSVQDWYDEVSQFNSYSINPFTFDSGAGHYTQVVWAETDEVGCGMVYYRDGGWYSSLLVCNYRVAGNMQGSQMYIPGEACSQCPAGHSCQQGLCEE